MFQLLSENILNENFQTFMSKFIDNIAPLSIKIFSIPSGYGVIRNKQASVRAEFIKLTKSKYENDEKIGSFIHYFKDDLSGLDRMWKFYTTDYLLHAKLLWEHLHHYKELNVIMSVIAEFNKTKPLRNMEKLIELLNSNYTSDGEEYFINEIRTIFIQMNMIFPDINPLAQDDEKEC